MRGLERTERAEILAQLSESDADLTGRVKALLYQFEDILRTLRHATWQERIFSDPALDAHTRKLLQPFVEWAKGLT